MTKRERTKYKKQALNCLFALAGNISTAGLSINELETVISDWMDGTSDPERTYGYLFWQLDIAWRALTRAEAADRAKRQVATP